MAETIVVGCPNCAKQFRISPDKIGRTFKCTGCENRFVASAGQPPAQQIESKEPPPLPTVAEQPYVPPPVAAYGSPGEQIKTSGMAIASLVCGILFCVPFCGLLAIIFGIIGINQTKPGMAKGRGMAIAGTILGSLFVLLSVLAVLISILLPSLNKARETANRIKCATNMRQIGMAILLYQNQNNQEYPPDLTTLWQHEQLTGSVFVCPTSNDTPAAGPSELTTGGHLSYVYLRPASTSPDSTVPILYENSTDHMNDGTNILFGDGHVEWESKIQAASILARVQPPAGP